jgi:hypothetical protein
MINLVFIYHSFNDMKWLNYVLIITFCRNLIPFFDLENYKEIMEPDKFCHRYVNLTSVGIQSYMLLGIYILNPISTLIFAGIVV